MNNAKPFVKWAGGKRGLLPQLEKLLPSNFYKFEDVTYIEPFVGGGAMLFHMLKHHKNIRRAVINDMNADLIMCYQLVKDRPLELIERLQEYNSIYYNEDIANQRELYYAFRDKFNRNDINAADRAALFIVLNKTCFNGLYRENALGKFNVPCGRYKKPIICDEVTIMQDHLLLNSIELHILPPGDYCRVSRNLSTKGQNFLYLDPPYRPLLNENNFKEYTRNPFGDKEQVLLKSFCDRLTKKGVLIMLSNSNSKNPDGSSFFEELYEGYDFKNVYAPRCINAFPNKRSKLSEVLIRNYK